MGQPAQTLQQRMDSSAGVVPPSPDWPAAAPVSPARPVPPLAAPAGSARRAQRRGTRRRSVSPIASRPVKSTDGKPVISGAATGVSRRFTPEAHPEKSGLRASSDVTRGGNRLADGEFPRAIGIPPLSRAAEKQPEGHDRGRDEKEQPTMMPNSGSDGPVSATMLRISQRLVSP